MEWVYQIKQIYRMSLTHNNNEQFCFDYTVILSIFFLCLSFLTLEIIQRWSYSCHSEFTS